MFKRNDVKPEPTLAPAPEAAPTPALRIKTPKIKKLRPEVKGPMSIFVKDTYQAAPYSQPRALTAAAVQIKVGDKEEYEQFRLRRSGSSSAWQQEAWEYYDAIGEIKYAFNLVASVISRIRLYVAVNNNPAEAPSSVRDNDSIDQELAAAAERALTRLDSAYGGQAGMLRDAALNLSVVGECYLVQMPERKGSKLPESWDIRSVDELITNQKNGYDIIDRRDAKQNSNDNITIPNNAFIGRIWKNHARFSGEADSSMRGILDLAAELLLLNRTFRATARSRLNAGAMYLPDGLSTAAQGDPNAPFDSDSDLDPDSTVEEAEDEFEEQLIDAMTTPIRDEESASAVVPLLIRGPADLGEKIKIFKFERAFDPALAERSDRVLDRILQGLDVPKDIVTGLANVRYSNALQIEEGLYKAHIEPLMLLIVDALTVVYLRPYLESLGYPQEQVAKIVIWYDPSAVATRNDRAADADTGLANGSISYHTWRRAHGFSEADAPSADELAIRMMSERGAITPELTEAMLNALAPTIMGQVRASQQAAASSPLPPALEEALKAGSEAAPSA